MVCNKCGGGLRNVEFVTLFVWLLWTLWGESLSDDALSRAPSTLFSFMLQASTVSNRVMKSRSSGAQTRYLPMYLPGRLVSTQFVVLKTLNSNLLGTMYTMLPNSPLRLRAGHTDRITGGRSKQSMFLAGIRGGCGEWTHV